MSSQVYAVTVRYDHRIARRALNLFFKRRLQWSLLATPAVLALFLYFYIRGSWTTFDQILCSVLIAVVGLVGYIYFLRRRTSYQFFQRTEDPSVHFEFTTEGVKVSSELGSSELKWKAFNEILKSAELWLLVYYGSGYLTLPIEALSPECRRFIEERLRSSKRSDESRR